MKFLTEIDFTIDEIVALEASLSEKIYEKIKLFPVLIIENIKFLRDLGVSNYKEIFTKFTHMFIRDYNDFKNTFEKYDTADLVAKLQKNPGIVEYL